jgi:hypothetical protein
VRVVPNATGPEKPSRWLENRHPSGEGETCEGQVMRRLSFILKRQSADVHH